MFRFVLYTGEATNFPKVVLWYEFTVNTVTECVNFFPRFCWTFLQAQEAQGRMSLCYMCDDTAEAGAGGDQSVVG